MLMNLLIAVGVVALGFVVGRWLYQKDTEVEDRRRAALKISAALREKGLSRVGDFLEDYAVGDYSGMLKKLKDTAVVLSTDAGLQSEFAAVFDKLLAEKLADPAEAADIAKAAVKASDSDSGSVLADVVKIATAKISGA